MSVLTDPVAGDADRIASPDLARLRAAAFEAKRRYPGVVGEILARECADWERFGFRFGGTGEIARLLEHLNQ